MATRGRPRTFDHAHISHRTIAYPAETKQAIDRIAATLGVSGQVVIQQMIAAGLTVFGEQRDD